MSQKNDDNKPIVLNRKTKETDIELELNTQGSQQINIKTGLRFFDHMLEQIAYHARWDLSIVANGDIDVDDHHMVEDVAIVLGQALSKVWRNQSSISRYGQRYLPMDETLVLCAIDVSGRPLAKIDLNFTREKTGDVSTEMWPHFFLTLAMNAEFTLHIREITSENNHHLIEASFKALAYALKEALTPLAGGASTKGVL